MNIKLIIGFLIICMLGFYGRFCFEAGQDSMKAEHLEELAQARQEVDKLSQKKLELAIEKRDANKAAALALEEQLHKLKREKVKPHVIKEVVKISECKRLGDAGLKLLIDITSRPE